MRQCFTECEITCCLTPVKAAYPVHVDYIPVQFSHDAPWDFLLSHSDTLKNKQTTLKTQIRHNPSNDCTCQKIATVQESKRIFWLHQDIWMFLFCEVLRCWDKCSVSVWLCQSGFCVDIRFAWPNCCCLDFNVLVFLPVDRLIVVTEINAQKFTLKHSPQVTTSETYSRTRN